MFQEPKNIIAEDHFFFSPGMALEKECNAPKDTNGVFKVLELRKGKVSLVYIGYSDKGGLFNEIVNGLHIDSNPRKLGWPIQLHIDKTDALDVYWYVIPDTEDPKVVQTEMLKPNLELYGTVPIWNRELK